MASLPQGFGQCQLESGLESGVSQLSCSVVLQQKLQSDSPQFMHFHHIECHKLTPVEQERKSFLEASPPIKFSCEIYILMF